MFLSESDYDSLCTFPLQLSWGPHSHFFLLADYLCSIFVTAFVIFPICRLSLLYTCDCIRTFFHLQIISCATPPLRLCLGMLTGRNVPCMDKEYSRGLRYEMQASFRHQAHCLSGSEFGRLADNRRMQRVANAAVLHVHTREYPAVTPHHNVTPHHTTSIHIMHISAPFFHASASPQEACFRPPFC